jgi:hypothetical protein
LIAERLLRFLVALNHGVEIVVRPHVEAVMHVSAAQPPCVGLGPLS